MLINTFENSEHAYSQDSWILIRPLRFLAAASAPAHGWWKRSNVFSSWKTAWQWTACLVHFLKPFYAEYTIRFIRIYITSCWLHHHDPIWYFAIFFLTLLEAKGKVEEEAKESEEKETYLTLKISAELQSIGIELYNEDKDPVRGWRYQSTAFSKLNVTIGHVSVYSIFKYIYQWRI